MLSSATVAGILLVPTAAFAGTHGSGASGRAHPMHAKHSRQAGNAQAGTDPDTTVTFSVTSGDLTISAPTAANLGSGAPGTNLAGHLGTISVNDQRALVSAAWTVTASSSDFITGTGLPSQTIPATDVNYDPGFISKTGNITVTGSDITMSNSSQPVVVASSGVGNNSASWNPTLTVSIPAAAVFGTYTATVAHSIS
jgi:hypothetical protein